MEKDNVEDFLRYETMLEENETKAVKIRPVLGVVGALALLAAVCGLTFGGLKYLEYRGELIINQPAETGTDTNAETLAEDDVEAPFRLVKKLRSYSGFNTETVYEYDEHGRQIKETETRAKGEKEITEYTYGERGELVNKTTCIVVGPAMNKKKTTTESYVYEDGKHLTSIISITTEKDGATDQTTKTETKYVYNDNWQIVRYEYDHCTTHGGTTVKMHYYTDYTYTDENGSYTLIQKSNKGEITTGQVTLDKFGNVVKSVMNINGEITVTENEYDEHGKITKNSRDGNVIIEGSYTYDNDVLIREDVTLHNADGDQKTYNLYRYDEYGNEKEFSSYTEDGNLIEKTTYEWEPTR